jgi:prepilin-type N-terminal cleavage/methylation domain-containing protein
MDSPRFFPSRTSRERRGFSLVEVLVAMALLLLVSGSVISAFVFASRLSRLSSNAIAAKNIAQGYFEKMAIDEFKNVGPTNYPNIEYDSVPPLWLDRAADIRCKVEFKFSGFGTIENGSANNITDAKALWENDEWVGDTLCIVSGPGMGQTATITGNTPNTIHHTAFDIAPKKGAKYLINYGKTVQVTTTWQYMGKEYSQTIRSLIVNRKDNTFDMGF